MSKRKRRFNVLKWKHFRMKKLGSFISNKRGVSEALSTMIITAGVIAMGIAVLYWAYSWGNVANTQFTQTVQTGSQAVEERLSFEYITYSNNVLTVNMLNWGDANNVTIARVYIWDNSHNSIAPITFTPLKNITTSEYIQGNTLNIGQEGKFTVNTPNLNSNSYFVIRVVTDRGRNFDGSFST